MFFFDEGRFGLMPAVGRCWALKGEKARAPVKPGYKNFYLYSSVSPFTGESFTLILPWVNTEVMNLYLEKMSSSFPDKRILLIMDQAGWHCSKNLEKPKNIFIELLPPYSPELNPVEKLWWWLRLHVCRNRVFDSLKDLVDALCVGLNKLTMSKLASLCNCNYLLHNN